MAAKKGNDYNKKREWRPQHDLKDIQAIIDAFLQWAAEGEGISIARYLWLNYHKDKSWLHSLGQTYPEVTKAIELARPLIAGKLHDRSLSGVYNATYAEKVVCMYDDDYKEQIKWKSRLMIPDAPQGSYTLADIKALAASGQLAKMLAQTEEEKR